MRGTFCNQYILEAISSTLFSLTNFVLLYQLIHQDSRSSLCARPYFHQHKIILLFSFETHQAEFQIVCGCGFVWQRQDLSSPLIYLSFQSTQPGSTAASHAVRVSPSSWTRSAKCGPDEADWFQACLAFRNILNVPSDLSPKNLEAICSRNGSWNWKRLPKLARARNEPLLWQANDILSFIYYCILYWAILM